MIKATQILTTGMGKFDNFFIVRKIESKFWRLRAKHQGSPGDVFQKIEKKLPFKVFKEKMGNYISRNMKYVNKVVGIVDTYKDVRSTYNTWSIKDYIENDKGLKQSIYIRK